MWAVVAITFVFGESRESTLSAELARLVAIVIGTNSRLAQFAEICQASFSATVECRYTMARIELELGLPNNGPVNQCERRENRSSVSGSRNGATHRPGPMPGYSDYPWRRCWQPAWF
jgi:hypothetical protein